MRLTPYLKRLEGIFKHPSNRGHWWEIAKRSLAVRLAVFEDRPVEFGFLNGTTIRCWPHTHAIHDLAYFRVPDYAQMGFMLDYLKPGDNVLDIGANLGLYTVLAGSLIGPDGFVDAVEAVPDTARRLLENVALNRLNQRVVVHPVAVGSDAEWAEMTVTADATNRMVVGAADHQAVTVRVKVDQLDTLATRPSYSFGKIDVEGREWDTLRGAERLLANRSPPVWIVEINGGLFQYGHQVAPFVSWMAERGFDPWMYEPESKTFSRLREHVWGDVFFIARDSHEAIQHRIPSLRWSGQLV